MSKREKQEGNHLTFNHQDGKREGQKQATTNPHRWTVNPYERLRLLFKAADHIEVVLMTKKCATDERVRCS